MINKLKEFFENFHYFHILPYPVCAILMIAVTGMVYKNTESDSAVIWIIAAAVYIAFCSAYFFISRRNSHAIEQSEGESFLGNITLDLIVKMNIPVMLCNSSENIIWINNAFTSKLDKRDVIGMRFDTFSGIALSEIKHESQDGSALISAYGRSYSVSCFPVQSKSKKYWLTVWNDRTELDTAIRTMNDEEIMVAYVMADNIEELSQYAKEGTRNAANEIENVLKDWAEGSNGILKEYQSDRYIFLFRSAEMANFVDKKFDVLDRIREIRVGESSLSVTVSMGIAQVSGTLADKERVASEALDMALQRGGDQVVVKSAKGLEFFGGKTQTVQKRTKVRARVIANELAALITKSSNVIIMGHRASDFDCIGACLGVARLASFCGIKFNIVVNPKDPNFIRCYEHISSLPEYRESSVFINSSEAQDLITSDTLTVIVDVNNKLQLEAPNIAEISHRTVYIDHHRKTAEFDEAPLISYIEPSASSASELVAEILEQALPASMLLKEEADIMYSGILLDTKQFTKNAGVRTFGAALYLRGEGANPTDAQLLFRTDIADFMSEAKFEANIVVYRKIMAISCNDDKDNTSSDRIAAAKAADKLLTIDGIKASFALCRIDDKIHISARSSGEVNVQLILEKIEGGGHFDSAATQLTNTMVDALSRLKNAIDEYLAETKN